MGARPCTAGPSLASTQTPMSTSTPRYPSLYQINTRVWLTEWSRQLGRPATLDDVPDAALDRLAQAGFDWVWLLSVWQTGQAAQRLSRSRPEWRREFEETLPDLCDEDIAGSGFAITGYHVHTALGGDAALGRLRERMRARGLRLMLDFVPNHMAPDHPWAHEHPEFFVPGSEEDLARWPLNYCRLTHGGRTRVLAHGRDPYFPGWPDTLQLNYGNPALQQAMTAELLRIAGQCDGVRCDMAMLILPDVFESTWGIQVEPFWPRAIGSVRAAFPQFLFMAEVYWDREWTIQQQGFDYAYDKRLYDRLRDRNPCAVREHLGAGLDFQDKLARFIENHDEARAAAAFPPGVREAAAVTTFFAPGLRFFHQGQFEARMKRISPHLVRAPHEEPDPAVVQFHERLLAVLREPVVRDGVWRLAECVPAWEGNGTWDCFIAQTWELEPDDRLLAVVNYAPCQSQCYVRLPFGDLEGHAWELTDLLGSAVYERDGDTLREQGLYLDVPGWQAHVFRLRRRS